MSLRVPTLLCVAFAASACIFGGGGGSDPENGTWAVGEVTVDSNDCGLDPAATEVQIPTGFYLFREFTGEFTFVTVEDEDNEIDCEEDVLEGIFECDRETYTAPLPPTSGLSVRNRLSFVPDGNKKLMMTMSTRADCEGGAGTTGCKIAKSKLEVADFPCDITQVFEATWESDELGPLDPLAGLEE